MSMTVHQRGFTLIELVITIIILSFAAMVVSSAITSFTHSSDAVLREQAISLAQAMMSEIMAKKWDENSPNGGNPPICSSESRNQTARTSLNTLCSHSGAACAVQPCASTMGLDSGETSNANDRTDWDDIDDYSFLNQAGGNYEQDTFWNQNGGAGFSMTGFSRWVEVDYIASNEATVDTSAGISAGTTAASATDTKRIIVLVSSPLRETFTLVATVCNY